MGFIKRAFLYVTRKKGKSILLFSILLIMATFVLTGLSIRKASDITQQKLRQSLGGTFLLGVDYTDANPYLHQDANEYGFIFYSTEQLTPENIGAVKQIPGVKYCDARNESLAVFEDLSWFTGNIPIEEEFRHMTKTVGVWRTEDNELFTSGALSLTEGRHITETDTCKALISQDLADKNKIKTGDIITTHSTSGKKVEIEVAGLFVPQKLEGVTDQVTTYDKIQNRIFIDLNTAIAIEDSPAVQGFYEVNVTVDDPENMDRIISEVRKITSIAWEGFTISMDNETYLNAAKPLNSLKELIAVLLLVIIAVSAVILSLVLTLWAKTRIHETGVFLSAGISKSSVAGQYLTEVLMLAVLAFGLSFFTSNAVADQIAGHLLEQSVHSDQQQNEQSGGAASASSASFTDEKGLMEPEGNSIHVSIGIENLLQLYLIGFVIIIISVGVSALTVMRMKPREILSKMS